MADVSEQIRMVLEDTIKVIRQRMEEEGENATGRTSLSFRVKEEPGKLLLVGGGSSSQFGGKTAPIKTLEIGREPGGDWKQLRPIIVKWTVDKGFNFSDESHRWAVSTIISKRIVDQGTKRYQNHVNVYSEPVEKATEIIREIIGINAKDVLHAAVVGGKVESSNTNF